MKKRILFILLAVVLALSVGLIGCGGEQEEEEEEEEEPETLKIGALLSLTGWYSVIDALEADEVQAVAQLINDGGGITIDGQQYQIELVIEDAMSDYFFPPEAKMVSPTITLSPMPGGALAVNTVPQRLQRSFSSS